ncbi:MAG TPA: alanine racemase [Chloroflexia bacterium]|jgi:D-serine deaminase-like pyridoxal phosphate-dependent protein
MTRVNELDTPALLVDLKRMQRNIAAMQAACDLNGVGMRPHTKTHKSPAVARLQVAAGARGITVAKVGEAEVMAEAGFDDLFIAYPLIGESKYRRLLPLLERANSRGRRLPGRCGDDVSLLRPAGRERTCAGGD